MNIFQRSWAIVRENRRAYLIINATYYGLVAVCMVYVAFNRPLQTLLMNAVGGAFSEGPLAPVGAAYGGRNPWAATALTFVVNLLIGSLLTITVPSLIVPFSGLLMGAYRAVLWGLMLSPAHPDLGLRAAPHMLTLALEGQAYVIALLAAYVQGRSFLWPKSVGVEGRRQGYGEGLKRTAWLYVLVIALLAVAALYEALEVIYLIPILG